MDAHLPILIVGAGPTGLMMACELARYNVPFRIIEKNPQKTQGSNATWIQTRTLEIFSIIGMVDQFLKIGHRCNAINFYVKGEKLTTISLTQIDSLYPFILMVPQSETERLLSEKLEKSKIYIERSSELINIKQTNNGIVSTVRLANGDIENIISDWVIACDGANSTIRKKCQIEFSGEDLSEQFMVADAEMSSFLPSNEIHAFFDKGTIFPDRGTLFSAFPWGERQYRLSANLYLSHPRQTFTEQDVKEIVAERTYGNYIVESVSWVSPFWIHGKIVDRMREGAIFLAGDAAHIHSPAGGQGMNTGIQDAFNLAWKLALVINGKAKPSFLDSYQTERYPVIKNIVVQTDYLTKMVIFDKLFLNQLRKFSHKIAEQPRFAKKISMELAQLKIRYKKSPLIDYQCKNDAKLPQPGERAPNIKLNDSKNLFDYLDNKVYTILVFTGEKPTENDLLKIKELQKMANKKFPEFFKVVVISINKMDVSNIIDNNATIHQHYCGQKPAVYIIRPDNYIAYYSDKIDPEKIEQFVNTQEPK